MDLRSKGTRDRGATVPIVALLLPVLMLMTAFAVDLGRQRSSRRTMQARADIVALDLVRLTQDRTDGGTEAEIIAGGGGQPSEFTALDESADRNEVDPAKLTVAWGTWTNASGFVRCTPPPTPPNPPPPPSTTCIPDAVEVTAAESLDYFFQPGTGRSRRSAVASTGDEPLAGFSIGSFGASLDPASAGLLNTLITPILGSPPGVDALSYQGLVLGNVQLGELGAELGLVTSDDVLTTDVAGDDLFLAAATVLRRNGDVATAEILEGMITAQVESMTVTLGDFVNIGQGGEEAALASSVNVLSLVQGTTFLSQCTDPDDLSTCSGIAVPALTTTVPQIGTTTVGLRVIQGQQSAFGSVGAFADTSQVAADLSVDLGGQQVGRCIPANILDLKCLLGGLLGTVNFVDATVSLDASIELADGRGTIAAIDCADPLGLDIATRTGLYEMTVTVNVAFGKRGILGGLLGPLLGNLEFTFSTAQADVNDMAEFDVPPDVLGVTVEQTGTGSVGLSGLALTNVNGTAVLGTLASLGISQTVSQVLTNFVNPLLSQVDNQVLGPLTDILGVNVVGADITPLLIECDDTIVKLVE